MTEERYTQEMHEAFVKEQEAKARTERANRIEALERHAAKAGWEAGGGDPKDFDKAWGGIRDIQRQQRAADVLQADLEAREAHRRSPVSRV